MPLASRYVPPSTDIFTEARFVSSEAVPKMSTTLLPESVLFAGDTKEMVGLAVSMVIDSEAVLALPALSVERATKLWLPSDRLITSKVHGFVPVAGWKMPPSVCTSTSCRPEPESEEVPVIVSADVLIAALLVGEVKEIAGVIVSTVKVFVVDAGEVLPTEFTAVA